MTLVFFACSLKAHELMCRMRERWLSEYPADTVVCIAKCGALGELSEKRSLSECVGEWFEKADGLVFFCAAGIAVRSIAPYIVHKASDPAVAVMDETGRYGVSLLSGHAGGANALTERLCRLAGAEPVITTASDREGKFSVDLFALKNGLAVTDWNAAKELQARLLAGEKIGLVAEAEEWRESAAERSDAAAGLRTRLGLPEDVVTGVEAKDCQAGLLVSFRRKERLPFPLTLQLAPKVVALGIGCRRGASAEQIRLAAENCLAEAGILRAAVYTAASIDLKKEEPGLPEFCRHFFAGEPGREELPLVTFPAERLNAQPGEFTPSGFVLRTTGTDNVCERSAAAASGGKLLFRKKAYGGVTVALAARSAPERRTETT